MRLYLAGPMRNIAEFNFPAFHAAAKQLRAQGHEVFNPAEKDEEVCGEGFTKQFATGESATIAAVEAKTGFSLRAALKADTAWICDNADGIALLPGWERSKGATAEKALADALGLAVIYVDA